MYINAQMLLCEYFSNMVKTKNLISFYGIITITLYLQGNRALEILRCLKQVSSFLKHYRTLVTYVEQTPLQGPEESYDFI